MQNAPWQRTVEAIFCKEWYSLHDPSLPPDAIPEDLCKIAPVQGRVAAIVGWDVSLGQLPGLFLTVPYGILADKIGRKPVLVLSLFGLIIGLAWQYLVAFLAQRDRMNIQWSLASNAFNIIGGGGAVPVAMSLTMLADAVPPAQRATAFFRVGAAAVSSNLLALPLASLIMEHSPWAAMLTGAGVMLLTALIAIWLVPETLPFRPAALAAPRLAALLSPSQPQSPFAPYVFLLTPTLLALSSTFLAHSLARNATPFLVTLASHRFRWSYAHANIAPTLAALVTLVFLTLGLPIFEHTLAVRARIRPPHSNLILARASILVLVAGAWSIAAAPTPSLLLAAVVVQALGAGFSPAVRDVATALVPGEAVARLYAVLQTVDTVGGIVAGPALSYSFNIGTAWGGLWNGLPFALAGGLYVAVAGVVWTVRVPMMGDRG